MTAWSGSEALQDRYRLLVASAGASQDEARHDVSVACSEEDHSGCGHWLGSGLYLWRRGAHRERVLLCTCACHRHCPLSGRVSVAEAVWSEVCTCPGVDVLTTRREDVNRWISQRRAQYRLALRDVSVGEGRSTEEVQADLLASFRRHGIEPHGDLGGLASFLKAVHGTPALRLPRLANLGWHGYKRLRQAAREADGGRSPDAADHRIESTHGADLRHDYGIFAAYAITAVGVLAASRKSEGAVKVVLEVVAVLLAALAAWSVLFVGGLELVEKVARSRAEQPSGISEDEREPMII